MRYGEKLTTLWSMRTMRNVGRASYRRTSKLGCAALRLRSMLDRLDAALAPPHTAEPPVAFGLRIDQQEPGGPAGVVQALEQAPELGAHVRVRHPLGREYPGEAQPGDGLAHALQWLELGAAQFKLGRGGDADGLDEAVDPPLIVRSPAVLVDVEERVLVAAGDPADRITQFGRDAAGELLLDGRIGGSHRTVVRGK